MLGGELDDRLPPRMCFVFEDCVASRDRGQSVVLGGRRVGKRRRTVETELKHWHPNPTVVARMWDVVHRHDFRVDMITAYGPEWEGPLMKWVDRHDLPVSHVFATDVEGLNDQINTMVRTMVFFFGNPGHLLWFGGRGRQIPIDRDWEPLA